nr:helix-turn-helix domain-containing protein [uncultured Acidocella sp.]
MTKTSRSFLPAQASAGADRPLEKLIKLSAAAGILGVSAVTIRRRVADGSLTPVRINERLYFEPAELRAYIAQHRKI